VLVGLVVNLALDRRAEKAASDATPDFLLAAD
jgi:hypothetical protein